MRRRHEGLANMANWADTIGRSTRILLGLERGEAAGAKTLRRIEEVLGWPPGYADRILSDPTVDTAPDLLPTLTEAFEPFIPDPRPLDAYTTTELLREVEDRYNELAFELHTLGRPTMTSRQEDDGMTTVLEPMSPADRREVIRRERAGQQERPTSDRGGETRE